jgi:hypothetical protein
MNAKEEFIKIYKDNIKRDGADKLLEWLLTTDFFTSPASTRFHGNFEGGLCEHCVKVYKRLCKLAADEKLEVTDENIAVIALLHDICKVNTYKTDMRNVKENGEWVQKPYYTVDDALPYGHGEKSVYIIGGFMKLTREEAMAINWHMGPYDARNSSSTQSTLASAFKMYPLVLLTFIADITSSYLDEEIK